MSLPSGYTRLEYIESTGTQYIDTGVRPTVNTSFQFGIYMLEQTGGAIVGNVVNDDNDYRIFNYSGEIYWDFGSGRLIGTGGSFPANKKFDFKVGNNYVNRNGERILTGSKVTDFTADSNILVFRGEQEGNSKGRIYYLKIWGGSAVVRDFVPCRNAAGRVGLWDSASGAFYGNAGTGDFAAGPAYLGSHKTLVNGTAYEVKGGKCLVNGTAYSVKKGRTLVAGTGYNISFPAKGTPLGDFPHGSLVKLKENGTPVEFYVAKHDYEESLNGVGRTLLVRKDCFDQRVYSAAESGWPYQQSDLRSFYQQTYPALLEGKIREKISTTRFKVQDSNESDVTVVIEDPVFQLSVDELVLYSGNSSKEGSVLPIADILFGDFSQWTRTPQKNALVIQNIFTLNGKTVEPRGPDSWGIFSRPALTLPAEILVDEESNIIT